MVVSAGIICEDTKERSIGTRKTLTLRAEGEQLLIVKLISGLVPHLEFDQEPDLYSTCTSCHCFLAGVIRRVQRPS